MGDPLGIWHFSILLNDSFLGIFGVEVSINFVGGEKAMLKCFTFL